MRRSKRDRGREREKEPEPGRARGKEDDKDTRRRARDDRSVDASLRRQKSSRDLKAKLPSCSSESEEQAASCESPRDNTDDADLPADKVRRLEEVALAFGLSLDFLALVVGCLFLSCNSGWPMCVPGSPSCFA